MSGEGSAVDPVLIFHTLPEDDFAQRTAFDADDAIGTLVLHTLFRHGNALTQS